jgi:hypothetical protein
VEALPVFAGRRTCAERLGCWMGHVEREIGGPDILVRFGVKEDPAWLLARIDHLIKFSDGPIGTLYGRKQSYLRCGITTRVAERLLTRPVALFAGNFGKTMLPLFCERQLESIRDGISAGTIRIQTRSLKLPKKSAYVAPARHIFSEDLRIEDERINRLQFGPKFWSSII